MKKIIVLLLLLMMSVTVMAGTPPPRPSLYNSVAGDSTDVTVALQAALDAAKANDWVFTLDSGTYYLTDSIVVPEGVTFSGSGEGTKLHFEQVGNAKGIILHTNTTIGDMEIDFDSAGTALTGDGRFGNAIVLGKSNEAEIDWAENITMKNLYVSTELNYAINGLGAVRNIDIENVVIRKQDGVLGGIQFHWGFDIVGIDTTTTHPNNISIKNVTIDSLHTTSTAIYLSGSYNLSLENIQIERTGVGVLVFAGDWGYNYANPLFHDTVGFLGSNTTLENVQVKKADAAGFRIYGLTSIPFADTSWIAPVSINNCQASIVTNLPHVDSFASISYGVYTAFAEDVSITNSQFTSFKRGIFCGQRVYNANISHNRIYNNQEYGIYVSDGTQKPDNINISGNRIYNNGVGTNTGVGVLLGVVNKASVHNNLFGDTLGETQITSIDVQGGIVQSKNNFTWALHATSTGAYKFTASTYSMNDLVASGLTLYDVVGGGVKHPYLFDLPDSGRLGVSATDGVSGGPRSIWDKTNQQLKFYGAKTVFGTLTTLPPSGSQAVTIRQPAAATPHGLHIVDTIPSQEVGIILEGDNAAGANKLADIVYDADTIAIIFKVPHNPTKGAGGDLKIYQTLTQSTNPLRMGVSATGYTFGVTDGTNGQVPTTNGSGVVTWNNQASSPWGEGTATNDTSVSYVSNDSIVKFRGSNDTTFQTPGDNSVLVISGKIVADSLLINNYIDFTAGVANPAHFESRLFYDDNAKSMAYYNNETSVTHQIGQEMWTRVRNISGSTIFNGQAVFINGGSAMLPTIALAKADNVNTAMCIGLVTQDSITNNSNGYITTIGEVHELNVNLTNFADGDSLYLSSDTAGAWVVAKPEIVIPIGWVNNAHSTQGIILVDRHHSVIDTNTVFGLANYVEARVGDTANILRAEIRDTILVVDIPAVNVKMDTIGASTFTTAQDIQDVFHSTGYVSGGAVNDTTDGTAGDSIYIAAGTGLIRAVDNDTTTLSFFDWGDTTIFIETDSTRFIGIEYNAGSPRVYATASQDDFNYQTTFDIATVVNEGDVLHIETSPHAVGDHANKMIRRIDDVVSIQRDNRTGGLILGETGTRYMTVTAGNLWDKLNIFAIPAINTTPAGDDFDRYYSDGGTGFTKETAQTQWNNTQYDDGDGVLATINNNRYAVQWFYLEIDGDLVSMYGTNEYVTSAGAELESPPTSLPSRIEQHGILIGRLIFQESNGTAVEIQTVFTTTFQQTQATDHGNLAGLSDTTDHLYAVTDNALTDSLLNYLKESDTSAYTITLQSLMGDSARQAVEDSMALVLRLTGGTVTGDVELNGFRSDSTVADSAYTTKGYVDGQVSTPTLNNVTVFGDIGVSGYINQWQHGTDLDLSDTWSPRGVEFALQSDSVDGGANYDSAFLHPSVVYVADGFLGYKTWMVTTASITGGEEPYIWVTNTFDTATGYPKDWHQFIDSSDGTVGTGDTLFNPVMRDDSLRVGTPTDGILFFGHDQKLWVMIRHFDSAADSVFFIARSTTDGLIWSDTTTILELEGFDDHLSPTIFLDTNSTYKMFIVERNDVITNSTVDLYSASSVTGTWTYIATTDMAPTNNTTRDIWHLSVVPLSPDYYLSIINEATDEGQTQGGISISESRDGGLSWGSARQILDEAGGSSVWDAFTLYRADGYWFEQAGQLSMKMIYSAKRTGDDSTWGTGVTDINFYDSSSFISWDDTAMIMAQKSWVRDTAILWSDTTATTGVPTKAWVRDTALVAGNTKQRQVNIAVDGIAGRNTIPVADSVHLSLRITDSLGVSCLAKDSTFSLSSESDTLFFTWDALPADLVSVDSVIFTYRETGISSIGEMFEQIPSTGAVNADSTTTTDLIPSTISSATWARVAYYVNRTNLSGGEQYGMKMRTFIDNGENIWIGRMYLKCTVEYTY